MRVFIAHINVNDNIINEYKVVHTFATDAGAKKKMNKIRDIRFGSAIAIAIAIVIAIECEK